MAGILRYTVGARPGKPLKSTVPTYENERKRKYDQTRVRTFQQSWLQDRKWLNFDQKTKQNVLFMV